MKNILWVSISLQVKAEMMPWKTEYLDDLNIIETTLFGIFPVNEIREVVKSVLDLVSKQGTKRLLVDCSHLVHSNTVFDIYELPIYYESVKLDRGLKQAVVLPISKDSRKNVEFYETVTRNRGYNVCVHKDRQAAIKWLLE